MDFDAKILKEGSSDADILCLSTVSLEVERIQELSLNVKKDVTQVLQELERYEKEPVKTYPCIKRLWEVSSRDTITGIISQVNENNHAQYLVNILGGLRLAGHLDKLSNPDSWNTSSKLLDCLCLFSKYSEEFCRSLVNCGIIKILEDCFQNLTDKSVLKDKTSKPHYITKAFMCLVKNLTKNLSVERLTLRKCFLTILNNLRTVEGLGVFATIGSVLLCNRCEAKRETESRETVPCIVYWVTQSFDTFNDPASWNGMYNLQDATEAIWILANFGSSSRFFESIVLHTFHRIIKTASLPEQIQTIEIIWVLCFDLEFEKLIKGDKIVKTMRLKERNDKDLKLLRRLNAVLTILRERYFPRSISLESSEVSSGSVARIVYHKNNLSAARKLYDKLRAENVSVQVNDLGENDAKYFETVVAWMQNCYCLIICVSEFTETDYDSRTILYIAEKLYKDIIAVFVTKDVPVTGWICQQLKDIPCFDFMESPFYVQDLSKQLVAKSIRFSQKFHGFRNTGKRTRSLGSLTGQSNLSMLSDCSDIFKTSTESVGEIGKQSSSERASLSSLTRDSVSSHLNASSFENEGTVIPERFKMMKKRDVSKWLESLKLNINVRYFKDVDGSVLWELATSGQTCDPFDELSYDEMLEQFHLTDEQKVKFTDALLKL